MRDIAAPPRVGQLACGAALLLVPVCGLAHAGHAHDSALEWLDDWWIKALLAASAIGYARGAFRLRAAGRGGVLDPRRVLAFCGGMLLLVIALLSPLDALAEHSFAAHMTQHLLLMLGAPPLLVYAQPVVAWMWCLEPTRRRAAAKGWASGQSALRRLLRPLLHPATVWCTASFALWFWHIPGPYAWALADERIHALEHACFFLTSLAFFYLLFAPRGRARLGYGGALMFGISFGIQNGFLGAILTFAPYPLYAAHASAGTAFGLTALEDQQLAGLIMWVPASIVHLSLLGLLCLHWLRDEERRQSLQRVTLITGWEERHER